MTITYKLLGNCPIIGTPLNSILKKETVGVTTTTYSVPKDEGNTDYQEYLAWVAEGNTPEAAD